jgi:hypothetical protein
VIHREASTKQRGQDELAVALGQDPTDVFAAVDAAEQPHLGDGQRPVGGHSVRRGTRGTSHTSS